jgi:hypothetical protein
VYSRLHRTLVRLSNIPSVRTLAQPPAIERPSVEQVNRYLAIWRQEMNNEPFDSALKSLFSAMPRNTDVGEVAVKLAALNGLYATNILAVTQVATHIASLDIDARLAAPEVDAALIEDIARVTLKGKVRRNYSFATKYCSFHRPDLYPIYDRLVRDVLNTLLRQGEAFDAFGRGERWHADYAIWNRSITKFRRHYGLEEFSLRDIDKYLWTVGRVRRSSKAS